MSLFDVIRYPISSPFTREEFKVLPEPVKNRYREIYTHMYLSHKQSSILLRRLIAVYDENDSNAIKSVKTIDIIVDMNTSIE
jgi:hypothetical protein